VALQTYQQRSALRVSFLKQSRETLQVLPAVPTPEAYSQTVRLCPFESGETRKQNRPGGQTLLAVAEGSESSSRGLQQFPFNAPRTGHVVDVSFSENLGARCDTKETGLVSPTATDSALQALAKDRRAYAHQGCALGHRDL
jgi:hypothetical protein